VFGVKISDKKIIVILILAAIAAGAAAAIFIRYQAPDTGPHNTTLVSFDRSHLDKSVYGIPGNISPRGFNIVFVSDGIYDPAEFLYRIDTLERGLKVVEPWKSYDNFNFFTVFAKDRDFCTVSDPGPMLKCDKDLIGALQPLGLYRFKVVIVSAKQFVAWSNVVRLENSVIALSLPQRDMADQTVYRNVWLHEFGHSFGLRDEMAQDVQATPGSAATTPGGPNCAPDARTAVQWWGEMIRKVNGTNNTHYFESGQNTTDVGLYYGCAGNPNYIKPTMGSLMNTHDAIMSEYGPVSERYLRKVLDYCYSDFIYNETYDPDFFGQYPEFRECLQGQ
jgi:hypothetical protein